MGDLIGRRLGEFEVVRELGRGGMGVVYEAVQVPLSRRVALKVLGPGLGLTPRAVERFRREAEAAAKLHHTNIVPVYATGEADGHHFYAMEYVAGPSLDQVIRELACGGREPTVPPRQPREAEQLAVTGAYVDPAAVTPAGSGTSSSFSSGGEHFDAAARMIAEVADALHHAHQQNIVHRDIKPSNLLLAPDGRLSVTDFGLARVLEQPGMTVTGEFVGTPAYMSPEQITAGRIPIDQRTDIYSLGATLYELLVLRPPFVGERRDQLLAMVIQKEPVPPRRVNPRVPRDLETICLKCVEKDPDRRYQTAKELAEDLRRYLNRFAILARRTGPLTRLKKWVRRNPVLSAACIAAVLAAATAGVMAYQRHELIRQRIADDARREEEDRTANRRAAMDKAILAAMSGQFAAADAALLDAERLGAELAERRFVAGIVSHYRGDSGTAKRLLLEACAERPGWLAPRAFLTVVCGSTDDFADEITHANKAFELSPETPDDYLFRGYMVGLTNPRRGLPDLDEAWKRRPSVLAQFIRADVLANLADLTGRVEDAIAARDALNGARPFMKDSPLFIATGLYLHNVGCNNCRLDNRPDEADRWLKEGEADFRRAGELECRHHPLSLFHRSVYLYLRDGTAEALVAESRDAGRRAADSSGCGPYLASLFRQGKTDEAGEYLRSVADTAGHLLTFHRVVFLIGTDLNKAQEECRRALAGNERLRHREWFVFALSLARLPGEADRLAKDTWTNPPFRPEWVVQQLYWNRVLAHAYGGHPMDLEAEIAGSRWALQSGYATMGYAALGRGHREEARKWFRKADNHPPVGNSGYVWIREIHKRLLDDDPWPPWIATKK